MNHFIPPVFLPKAVFPIAQQGMADVGHLRPDLMGAAGFQLYPHQRKRTVVGQHTIVGHGGFGPRAGCVKNLYSIGAAVLEQVIF